MWARKEKRGDECCSRGEKKTREETGGEVRSGRAQMETETLNIKNQMSTSPPQKIRKKEREKEGS